MPYQLSNKQKTILNLIWEEIGADVLACTGDSSLPREEVIEVVLDADRRGYSHICDPTIDWTEFDALPYDKKVKAAKEAFTFSRYGY